MIKAYKKGLVLILSVVLLTGCSPTPEPEPVIATQPLPQSDTSQFTLQEHVVPVVIKDTEIRVGETKLQTLLDQDIKVMIPVVKNHEVKKRVLDPEEMLAANTSYTEAFFWIEDSIFIHLSIEAKDEDIPMKEAVITRLELHLSHDKNILPDDVLVNGIPVTELTMTKAVEIFPDYKERDLSLTQRGLDYKCTLLFSPETQILYQFALINAFDLEEDEEEEYEYEYQDPRERIWPSQEK